MYLAAIGLNLSNFLGCFLQRFSADGPYFIAVIIECRATLGSRSLIFNEMATYLSTNDHKDSSLV